MRRAFTLVELLVVLAVISVMVTVAALGFTSGKDAARLKGAVRDVYGAIRQARSTALLTRQPVVITYSTIKVGDETMAKVDSVSAKLMDSGVDHSTVETLSGNPLRAEDGAPAAMSAKANAGPGKGAEAAESAGGEGETVEEILFAPIDEDVMKGMCLKVVKRDEEQTTQVRKSKISVFSNVDYLVGKYTAAKSEAKEKAKAEAEKAGADTSKEPEDLQEPVSIAWEANGRVDPHQVWIYPEGRKPEDGMLIRVDRYGALKVLQGDGKEE